MIFFCFRGLRLAEVLKCPHNRKNIRATIECLRSKNATELVNSEWQGIAFGCAEFPFTPVIDGAFLDETPQKSLDTKNFKKTNVMMGANKDEGVFFIMYYLTDLFKNEETVFVNRENFIKSVGELNLYVKNVGREVSAVPCQLIFGKNHFSLLALIQIHITLFRFLGAGRSPWQL